MTKSIEKGAGDVHGSSGHTSAQEICSAEVSQLAEVNLHSNPDTPLEDQGQGGSSLRRGSWPCHLTVSEPALPNARCGVGSAQRNGEAICLALHELPTQTIFPPPVDATAHRDTAKPLPVETLQSCRFSIMGWETLFLIFLLGTVPFLTCFNRQR